MPPGGLFLIAGADVQEDRNEVSIRGRGLESWLIDHIVIDDGPSSPEAWVALTRLVGTIWPHAGGTGIVLSVMQM